MSTLLVTNDFPPAIGGIQSYLRDFVDEVVGRKGPGAIVVFAPKHAGALEWDSQQPYTVVRWKRPLLLPAPAVARRMAQLIEQHGIETVWFGAAAPLAVMGAKAKKAGATKIVATTHGHEVGWSMVPGARQCLNVIGRSADTVTYISDYTLRRFRRAFGTSPEFTRLPSGVDTDFFRPATEEQRRSTRTGLGLDGGTPLVVCSSRLVPRKGQDVLVRVWPEVRRQAKGATLVIVGEGRYGRTLRKLAGEGVLFTGRVERERLRDIVAAADVFAMPARTRGRGLDVEGLGIVYLEAQACAVPVVAGDSGGAPETVTPRTGIVVGGRDERAIVDAITRLLFDASLRTSMGHAGRAHVAQHFSWQVLGDKLVRILG